MKKLLLPVLLFGLALPALANPTSVTTTKRSAVAIGNGSFALVKGTKLEVVAREGDTLIVKYRTSQGKIPVADTDYPAEPAAEAEPVEETAKPAPAATPAPAKAAAPVASAAKPTAPVTATPPALNTSGTGQLRQATAGTDPVPAAAGNGAPATNYGKAVQKAKQASEAHKSTHVEPTKGIIDEEKK